MSHCLSLALPSFPFALEDEISLVSLHSPSSTLIKPDQALLLLEAHILSSDIDYPNISALGPAEGQVSG